MAVGRDGGLPRAFAWTHPRFHSPWTGVATSVVITLVLGAWLGNHYGPFLFFAFLATTASLGILLVYIFVAAGGAVMFWRERQGAGGNYNPFLDALLPLVAIVICAYHVRSMTCHHTRSMRRRTSPAPGS